MMKMMILAPRKPSMTHAQFRRYVTEIHGPLVLSIPEVADGIRHYHYNFPAADARDDAFGHPMASHLDIVTQGWFDSLEAQRRGMAERRYREIIRPDEGRFADESRAVMHCMTEKTILDGTPTMSKIFYFRRRHPTLTRAAFQEEWLARFPAALEGHIGEDSGIGHYVQNHALSEDEHPGGDDAKYFDLIDEWSLTTPTNLARIAADRNVLAKVLALENELLDTSRTRAFRGVTVHNIP